MRIYSLLMIAALSCAPVTHASQHLANETPSISLPSRPSLQAPLNLKEIQKWSELTVRALMYLRRSDMPEKDRNDLLIKAQSDALSVLSDILQTGDHFGLDNPSKRTLGLLSSAKDKILESEESLQSFSPHDEGAIKALVKYVAKMENAAFELKQALDNHKRDQNPNGPNTIAVFDDNGNNRGYLKKNGSSIHVSSTGVNRSITGPLPSGIFEGSDRKGKIRLSDASFSGNIPTTIGKFEGYSINLSKNELTGTIPESIGNCKNLAHIDLSQNQLTGEMPSTFAQLKAVREFNMHGNNFIRVVLPDLPEPSSNQQRVPAIGAISGNPLLSFAPYNGKQIFTLAQPRGLAAVHFDGAALSSAHDIWHALHTLATNPLIVAKKVAVTNFNLSDVIREPIIPIRVEFTDRKEKGTWSAGRNASYALALTIHSSAMPGEPKTIRVEGASDALKSRLGTDEAGIQKMLEDIIFEPTPPANRIKNAASAR